MKRHGAKIGGGEMRAHRGGSQREVKNHLNPGGVARIALASAVVLGLSLLTEVSSAQTSPPPPAITSITPTSGVAEGGNTITLTGSGFTGVTAAWFTTLDGGESGNYYAPSFSVLSDSEMTVAVPYIFEGAPVNTTITVESPAGDSTPFGYYAITSATSITTPVVTGLRPGNGPATGGNGSGPASGGETVQIEGSGFTGATSVDFGTVPATFTVDSDAIITATSPAHTPGEVAVIVTNVDGTSATAPQDQYLYTTANSYSIPTITAITPTSGVAEGGNTITLTGSGFTGVTAAWFTTLDGGESGNYYAPSFSVLSDSEMTVAVPYIFEGAPVNTTITVESPAGDSTPFGYYAITSATSITTPVVTSLSPTSGPPSGGASVQIDGSGFTATTHVDFGKVAATSFVVVTDGVLDVTAPAGKAGNTVDVRVTNNAGTSKQTKEDHFNYLLTVPVVTTQPNSVTTSEGSDAVFSSAASKPPTPTVTWEVSDNEGSSWADLTNATLSDGSRVSGSKTDRLSISNVQSDENGHQYRALFTNSRGSSTSTSGTLTVVSDNGSGTMTLSPNTVFAGSSSNTLTFTYTAAPGGMYEGAIGITTPSDWPAPSGYTSSQGYSTVSGGTGVQFTLL